LSRVRIGALLAVCLGVVAIAVVLVLLDSAPRQAGSNYVPEFGPVVTIEGRGEYCQEGEIVPGDAAALRLLVGTYREPTPPVAVTIRREGRQVSRGALPGGREEGHQVIPVTTVEDTTAGATVCVRVGEAGEGRRTVLFGTLEQVRFEWLRPGSESWLEVLPTIAHRFGLGKPLVSGWWLLAGALLLLAAAWAMALRLLVRELAR
jgi:hypothetical protein